MLVNSDMSLGLAEGNFASPASSLACLSATPELAPASSEAQSETKKSKSGKRTRKSKSSPISPVVSTSDVGVLQPYWNERCRELQSRLWSPTETDSRALGLPSSNGSSSGQVDRSRHLIAMMQNKTSFSQMCSSDLLPAFATPTTDDEPRPKTKQVTRKIRIYPTGDKRVWMTLLHASRRAYNLCVAVFRNWSPDCDDVTKDKTAFRRAVREQVLADHDVPSVLADEAVNAAYLARKAVIKQRTQGEKAEFQFRSRKDSKQSFVVQKLMPNGAFPSLLRYHLTEAIPSEAVGKMANVVYENGRWFLCVKVEVPIAKVESQDTAIVACDPGVRTFVTTFSFSDCVKVGSGFAARLRPMLMRLDKLYSDRKKFTNAIGKFSRQCHYDRWRYFEKRIWSIKNKINDLVNDLHKRAADWLTTNYDVILLPTFATRKMSAKDERKISSKTVRSMLGLSHYKFKTYLHWLCYKRGKLLVECNEAYTSKTDSRTGEMVDVGLSSTINGMDRDVNGARGILLRALAT